MIFQTSLKCLLTLNRSILLHLFAISSLPRLLKLSNSWALVLPNPYKVMLFASPSFGLSFQENDCEGYRNQDHHQLIELYDTAANRRDIPPRLSDHNRIHSEELQSLFMPELRWDIGKIGSNSLPQLCTGFNPAAFSAKESTKDSLATTLSTSVHGTTDSIAKPNLKFCTVYTYVNWELHLVQFPLLPELERENWSHWLFNISWILHWIFFGWYTFIYYVMSTSVHDLFKYVLSPARCVLSPSPSLSGLVKHLLSFNHPMSIA